MTIGPLELLIFQGTPFCNIDCSYCYLPDRLNKSKISKEVIQQTLLTLVSDELIKMDFKVLWHAGEPLVLPISFYEEVFSLIRSLVPPQFQITHSFQTNGLLLDKSWCEFFKRHLVDVGLSIDGPEFIHDAHRKTRSGGGTFSKAIKAVELLKEFEMEVAILSVLTFFSSHYPEQLYHFFREIGAQSVSFNVEEIEGANTRSSFSPQTSPKKVVSDFFRTIYRLNLMQNEPIKIREINWAKHSLAHHNQPADDLLVGSLTGPFRTITVDYLGNFSTFSPELIAQHNTIYGDFILGNVLNDSFTQAAASEKFQLIHTDLVKGLERCKSNCEYYRFCGGGTPSNKVSEHHTLDADETLHCQTVFQAPLDALLEMIEEEQTLTKLR